jgi:hypothetical protein
MAKSPTSLSDKQGKFVREYLVDGNGARAAVEAGYGVAGLRVAACRLLAKANVQKALQARQSADATRLSISRIEVTKRLLDAYKMAEEQGGPMAMISAAREIGRMLGFYQADAHRVEVTRTPRGSRRALATMSDAELLAMMAAD